MPDVDVHPIGPARQRSGPRCGSALDCTIDGKAIAAADSDQAAPIIAEAWKAHKSIECRLEEADPASGWTALLGLAARVNRILESEGWQGAWWVPGQSNPA